MSVTLLDRDASALRISLGEAMRYMGVKDEAPEIKTIAEELLQELCTVAVPKACYDEMPLVFDGDAVSIGSITSDSASLRKCLSACTSAVIFAATVGAGADRLIARYSKLYPSKAVILGGLGSAMIESWCDEICRILAEDYGKIGKCVKPRFSPGYGGFDLAAQTDISRLLDTERRIGLYFTDSLMMIPEKSVTAVVGIFDKE